MSDLKFSALPTLILACGMAFAPAASAKSYLVKNQAGFDKAVKKLKPGDTLVLKSGKWKNAQLKFKAKGTAAAPITLMPQEAGKVILTGQSNLKMGGEHLIVTGLMFKDGYSPTREVVDFRADSATPCFNCRFVQNVIADYNKPKGEQDFWIVMRGQNNKVDHNDFTGKTNEGPALVVRLDDPSNVNNNHLIARNFFGYREHLGRNGGETIRIGTSKVHTEVSGTKVAQNYFEQTNGEAEIISIKSRGNKILENTFFEAQGAVVTRHGGDTIVARNVFFGGGVKGTAGIRVINDNQTVRDNYLEGVTGDGMRSAIAVMNGVPNSPANRYVQVSNAKITNNSFYGVKEFTFGAGANSELTLPPINSEFSGNVMVSDNDAAIQFDADASGLRFFGNRVNFDGSKIGAAKESGLTGVRAANGLLYPSSGTGGAPRDLTPVTRNMAGPKWYKKRPPVSAAKIHAHQDSLK